MRLSGPKSHKFPVKVFSAPQINPKSDCKDIPTSLQKDSQTSFFATRPEELNLTHLLPNLNLSNQSHSHSQREEATCKGCLSLNQSPQETFPEATLT